MNVKLTANINRFVLACLASILLAPSAYPEVQQCRDARGKPYFTDLGCPVNPYNKHRTSSAADTSSPDSGSKTTRVLLPQKYRYTPPEETTNPEITQETAKENPFSSFKLAIIMLVIISILFAGYKFNAISSLVLARKRSFQNSTENNEIRFEILDGTSSIFQHNTEPTSEKFREENYDEHFESAQAIDDESFLVVDDGNHEHPESDQAVEEDQYIAEENLSQETKALENELLTPYNPERPLIIDAESLSNDFIVGQNLLIFSSPSLKDMLKDISQTEILYTGEGFDAMLSQTPSVNEAKKLFRIIHSHEKLDIKIFLKHQQTHKKDNQVYYTYQISISPLIE